MGTDAGAHVHPHQPSDGSLRRRRVPTRLRWGIRVLTNPLSKRMLAAAAFVVAGSALLAFFVVRGAQAGVPLFLALPLLILPLLSIGLTARELGRRSGVARPASWPAVPHLRAHRRHEAGQTITLLTLLLPGLFGFQILVVLAGQLLADRRDLQSDVTAPHWPPH